MRLRCNKNSIEIVSESEIEAVYLESLFGIKLNEEKSISCYMSDHFPTITIRKKKED